MKTIRNFKMLDDKDTEVYKKLLPHAEMLEISALKGVNVDVLINKLEEILPEGPMYFPSNMLSDRPETFIIAEIIREKILYLLKEEVPHSIAVVIENMDRDEKGLLNINAAIIVERSSQKKIVIGNKGAMIKEIGTLARKDIVMLLGEKIYLEIWVKVEEGWRDKQFLLKQFGYNKEF